MLPLAPNPETALPRASAIALLLFALATPAGALANTAKSRNWAGYVVRGRGLSYRSVLGSWRQPRVSCVPGAISSASGFWVGLGGFDASPALEQIGTGFVCGLFGHHAYYAWYEMWPRPPVRIGPRVRPGDTISASVTVDAGQVTLSFYDSTRHGRFSKVLHPTRIDASSAEWIAEAPCFGASVATCLPLADFHSATFRSARAESSGGHLGSISDHSWRSTKVNLLQRLKLFGAGAASPSSLDSGGNSFTVTHSRRSPPRSRARDT